MNGFLTYLMELNIAIAVFFLMYQIVFRKDSNFNSRRIYLLVAISASIVLPFVKISFSNSVQTFNSPIIALEGIIFEGTAASEITTSFSLIRLLIAIYILITGFFITRLIISILKIVINIIRSDRSVIDGQTVYISNELHASSFFNLVFIDPSKTGKEDLKLILKHESYHARQLHSFDRILSEFLLSFNWFNPLLWLLRKSIVVNHEYQADNRVIELGTDNISYQLSILNQYIGCASISNQFSNQIKNRINMLNKNYKKGSFWKSSLIIPVSMALLLFLACNNEAAKDEIMTEESSPAKDEVFYVVESMPQWPGSEDMSLSVREFIAKNLYYPDKAKEQGAEGKVFVTFLVTKTGEVIIPDPSMLPPAAKDENGNIEEVVVVAYRPLEESNVLPDDAIIELFKEECVRVVELMPDLIPGKQRGKEVNVLFTMPITFKLQ